MQLKVMKLKVRQLNVHCKKVEYVDLLLSSDLHALTDPLLPPGREVRDGVLVLVTSLPATCNCSITEIYSDFALQWYCELTSWN